MFRRIAARTISLFRNRNFILVLALVVGLSVGEPVARPMEPAVLPLLALIMTLSATSVTSREFASLRAVPRPLLISLLLNYVVMGGLTLLMAWWLIDDSELWTGFVVLAASPPAVAVMPFSHLLGGDTFFSLIGMTGVYLAALAVMPVTLTLFFGGGFFDPVTVLIILGELILVPIIVSRILLVTRLSQRIEKWRGTIVNWCFFVVLFTIIGVNQSAFFGEINVLLRVGAVAVVITFVLGYAIELVARAMRVKRETTISMILMGTLKNYGLASGILLTLFSERAAIPTSIFAVFSILHVVLLGFQFRKLG